MLRCTMVKRGAYRRGREHRRQLGTSVVGLALIGGLSACQMGSATLDDDGRASGGYPSLGSVPAEPRPSTPIEERRQIVRELIEEHDRSRQLTSVVRRRSGLAAASPPPSSIDALEAEEIIPDAADGGGTFRLTPSKEADEDAGYREEATQFEDGGLGDFIRKLQEDTQPSPPQTPDEEDDVSVFLPELQGVRTIRTRDQEQPLLLAAFAPVVDVDPTMRRDVRIRLAADDEGPGLFCGLVGWAVAWSGVCLEEAEAASEDESAVGADIQQNGESSVEEALSGRSDEPEPSSSSEAAEERAERRLSEEDAVEAIEEAGRSALEPLAESLDKLQDYIRARQSNSTTSSSPERSRAPSTAADPRTGAQETWAEPLPPPIPGRRPEIRDDVTVVEDGETFDFRRTPTPAFKPSREAEMASVILPPEDQASNTSTDRPGPSLRPQARPDDLRPETGPASDPAVSQGEGAPQPGDPQVETAANRRAALDSVGSSEPQRGEELSLGSETTSASLEDGSPSPDDRSQAALDLERAKTEFETLQPAAGDHPDALVIIFEPDMQALPEGVAPRLEALLAEAKASDRKIFIIGEASTNHLAKRRATDVGAALVQFGATVEILEYDHDARVGVDQVRLVLKTAAIDPVVTKD